MFKKKQTSSSKQLYDRRRMIGRSTALIGASIFPSLMTRAESTSEEDLIKDVEDPIFNVKTFGASGIRTQNATSFFIKAIEACFENHGGVVYVPPGEYTVGRIELKDNITLYIDGGATLFLSQSRSDFPHGPRSMIYAENCKNISIRGGGTIDGLAQYEFKEMTGIDPEISAEIQIAKEAGEDMRRYYRKSTAMNTFMFILNNCTDFTLTDLHIKNSPLWNIRLNDCNRVKISRIYIYSDLEKGVNADGIDLCSCSDVIISDSVIVTGDDSIIVKTISRNGQKANTSENITVTNCILESSSTALGIGTETEADIKNILFTNCVIRNSNKGFGINVQDGAVVSNIIFSNLTIELNRRHWNWWGSAETCRIILKKRNANSRLGAIKDVLISNIISHPRGTSTMIGHIDQPLENITIKNMQLLMQPEDAADKRATDALIIEQVKDIKISDLVVNWTKDVVEKKWQNGVVLKEVNNLIIDSFSGRQGLEKGNGAAVVLDNVSNAFVRNSNATTGTNVFIEIKGENSKGIIIRNNDLRLAKKQIVFEKENLKKVVKIDLNV